MILEGGMFLAFVFFLLAAGAIKQWFPGVRVGGVEELHGRSLRGVNRHARWAR